MWSAGGQVLPAEAKSLAAQLSELVVRSCANVGAAPMYWVCFRRVAALPYLARHIVKVCTPYTCRHSNKMSSSYRQCTAGKLSSDITCIGVTLKTHALAFDPFAYCPMSVCTGSQLAKEYSTQLIAKPSQLEFVRLRFLPKKS